MVRLKIPFSFSIILLLSLIVLSLQLMSSAIQDTSKLSDNYTLLLLGNAVGTVILLLLVGMSSIKLQ